MNQIPEIVQSYALIVFGDIQPDLNYATLYPHYSLEQINTAKLQTCFNFVKSTILLAEAEISFHFRFHQIKVMWALIDLLEPKLYRTQIWEICSRCVAPFLSLLGKDWIASHKVSHPLHAQFFKASGLIFLTLDTLHDQEFEMGLLVMRLNSGPSIRGIVIKLQISLPCNTEYRHDLHPTKLGC